MPDSPDTFGQNPHPKRKSCRFKNIQIRVDGEIGILSDFKAFFPVELSDFLALVKNRETLEGASFKHLGLVLL